MYEIDFADLKMDLRDTFPMGKDCDFNNEDDAIDFMAAMSYWIDEDKWRTMANIINRHAGYELIR